MNLSLIAGFSGAGIALVIAVTGWIHSNGRLSKEIESRGLALTELKKKVTTLEESEQALKERFEKLVSRGEEKLKTLGKCLERLKRQMEHEQNLARCFVTSDTCGNVQQMLHTQFGELKQMISLSETKREQLNNDLLREMQQLYRYMGERGIIDRRGN